MKKSRLVRKTRLKPVSKRLAKELVEYRKLKARFLEENPYCLACDKTWGCLPWGRTPYGNRRKSKDVHHMRGRGQWLNVISTWLPVCRTCHDYIHQHAKWAREVGYILDDEPQGPAY